MLRRKTLAMYQPRERSRVLAGVAGVQDCELDLSSNNKIRQAENGIVTSAEMTKMGDSLLLWIVSLLQLMLVPFELNSQEQPFKNACLQYLNEIQPAVEQPGKTPLTSAQSSFRILIVSKKGFNFASLNGSSACHFSADWWSREARHRACRKSHGPQRRNPSSHL